MPAKVLLVQIRETATPIRFVSDEPDLDATIDMAGGLMRISKGGTTCGEFTFGAMVGWWYE